RGGGAAGYAARCRLTVERAVSTELGRPRGWQFIDLAGLGRNTGRSYAAALLRIVLYPLAAAVLLGLAVALGTVVGHPLPGSMDPIVGILIHYGLFIFAGFAFQRSAVLSHRRPMLLLCAPD